MAKKAPQTRNGKAFEYACLTALCERIQSEGKPVSHVASSAFNTAEEAFHLIGETEQEKQRKAARTAANLLLPLEPKLLNGKGRLLLSIATDATARGVKGDVRDVLCVRGEEDDWTIGMSCKHNHEGLRHPRITEKKDFGKDWLGINCSNQFMDTITPLTDMLIDFKNSRTPWKTVENKWDRFYVPILRAYLDEIVRMCNEEQDVPAKLLSYFFGANDFYKVIMKSSSRTTTIEGFNMHGTLNSPCEKIKAMTRVPILRMPTRLIEARFKERTKTTIILTFDGGWTISMRLHNKDEIAKPTSLAWEVELEGLPTSTYVNTHSWDE